MQKQNARAKAAGGFKVGEDLTKNRRAEAFYRRAIDDEMQKMLSSLYSRLAEVYTPVRVENAPRFLSVILNLFQDLIILFIRLF